MTAGSFTDSAIAARVARAFEDQFLHCHGLGWLTWDGRRWREVPDKVPREALRSWTVQQSLSAAQAYAAGTGTSEARKEWIKRESTAALNAVLALLAGLLSIEADALDAIPSVLNCANGVVHLNTGDLSPHNPRLFLTRVTAAAYDPTAVHEDWNRAVEAIPADVQPWLQVRYGQGITGYMTPDDKVIVQQGDGSNGKSTVLSGISNALGDYYLQCSDKVLLSTSAGAHTTDLADLRGARFASVEETPESGRLEVVKIKKLAGTERITARKMHKDNVTFPATHTLFVNTNYPPAVTETDEGTWRRLLLVVFPYRFTAHPEREDDRHGDPGLRERLKTGSTGQHEAALAWLVEGAVRWFTQGREMGATPERVLRDSEEWRTRTDHIAAFWGDHLDPDPESYVSTQDLMWLFNQYLRNHGNAPVAEATFARRFGNHPLTTAQMVTKGRVRQGSAQAMKLSRPFGSLDPHSRLPGIPEGQIRAWIGLRFRAAVNDSYGSDLWKREMG